jgi:glycerophosphoryl diester phosphodiesterase
MRVPLPEPFRTIPITHRGYHDDQAGHRPENTLAAFEAAIDAGYGIELDVQLTGDGQAMVFHDDTLDRLTGQDGSVLSHTAAELSQLRVLGSDQTIPTLQQVLDFVAGRTHVLIEIKDLFDTMDRTSGRLERATATALAGYRGPVAVMSFNPWCMVEMLELAPHLPRGLATEYFDPALCVPIPPAVCDRLRYIPDYDLTQSSFISHRFTDLDFPRVAELKSRGADVLCWTIKSPADEALARKIACNITFEGYPARIAP